MTTERHLVALALSRGADILQIDAQLDPTGVKNLDHLCRWLIRQGHVAAFSIAHAPAAPSSLGALEQIKAKLGDLLVEANLAAGAPSDEPLPSSLMAVWPFDYEVAGTPASSAQFLGLDLQLVAPASPDEEHGAWIPGLPGPRLVYAHPFCSDELGAEATSTHR